MRRWSFLELYALIICLSAVIGFAVAVFWFAHGVAAFVFPEFTVPSSDYSRHQSNDRFWNGYGRWDYSSEEKKTKPRPSEDELTAQREKNWQLCLAAEKRDGAQQVFASAFGLIVAAGFFWPHWRLARRTRQEDRNWDAGIKSAEK